MLYGLIKVRFVTLLCQNDNSYHKEHSLMTTYSQQLSTANKVKGGFQILTIFASVYPIVQDNYGFVGKKIAFEGKQHYNRDGLFRHHVFVTRVT